MSKHYRAEPEGFFNRGKNLYRLMAGTRLMASGMSGYDAGTCADALNAAEESKRLLGLIDRAKGIIERSCERFQDNRVPLSVADEVRWLKEFSEYQLTKGESDANSLP